jgi:hypothetical protein
MKILAGLLAGAALMLAFSLSANAFATLELSSGATTVTVTDGGTGDANGAVGVVTFIGPVGNFFINVTTGLSICDINNPYMDLNSVDFSGSSGSLKIRLSDIGFSSPSPAGFIFNVGGTTQGTISYAGYYDLDNALFGTTSLIGSGSFTGPGSFADSFSSGLISPASPLSLTEIINITHSGGYKNTSFDAEMVVTPEPGTILLLGSGLLGLAIYGRRRLKA